MAEVGVAFLSAILGVVFQKMDSPGVIDFIRRRKSIDKLLKKMKIALLPMNVVLEDAEEQQVTNPNVQKWIDELKDVAYSAEDILDEMATEALRNNLDAESHPVAGKVRNLYSSTFLNPFVHQVEPKIKEILDRLGDLTNQINVMALKKGVGGKQYPGRLTTSDVIQSDTFGRDEDKEKVIDLLFSSDAKRNEMCGVIAIVGIGGIGKTTLTQLVYNDSRVKQHFNLKIWFCVSEDFDEPKVKRSIIGAATSSECKIEDPEQLQVTIKENLNRNKFLLVLDDVWSEEHNHMEFLGQLLQFGAPGSKILVTTRNASVARAMHADSTHHLEQLPEGDCWSLFEKHAFRGGSSNADPKIKEIGRQIVNKCKGLPLAIKAIGDLLWSESDVERWTNILKSDLWDVSLEKTNILPALRLSYKYLPSYLKRCFAYCSIFPKDYVFEKNQLVLLWMAEGFLHQPKKESMEEVGNRYFDALISRSFFQQSSETNSGFVMHDLLNDLANFMSGQFGFMLEGDSSKEIGNKTRYISFINLHKFEKIEEDLYKAKQLRTFLTLDWTEFSSHKTIMPPRTWCLRTLGISGQKEIIIKWLDSISNMKHLRYLDVSSTSISRLPNSICMLCNLQTLKLSNCENLERLPRDMWKLINLRHLEIDRTDNLKEMPVKMGELKCLQTLTKFVVSKNNGSRIGELGKLTNLRGKLLISELQNVRSVKDSLEEILKDMVYLEELVLQWDHSFGNLRSHERSVLENLQPHENLKSLSIYSYGGKGFPEWMGGLPSLSMLELRDCKNCCTLPPLGQLPSLTKLVINGLDGVVAVDTDFYGNSYSLKRPFERLKFLELGYMSNWENWVHLGADNEVETFSQLEELQIYMCPKLRGKLPVHLPSLFKLKISDCEHLEGLLPVELFPKFAEQHEYIRTADFNNCLEERHIHSCSSLVSLPRDGLFSTLKSLAILNCKKLELPTHRQYSSLEKLWLINCCDSLTSFPLDKFPNLKEIELNKCWNLQSLEHNGGNLAISSIRLRNCPSLVSFPNGGLHAPNLAEFLVIGCERLRSMPDKMHLFLPSLHCLWIRNCPEVESFPEEGLPFNLKIIEITDCKRLIANRREWGLERLPSLETLEIGGGESEDVESFPGGQLLLPTTLSRLRIYSFSNLKSMEKEGFQHLISLVHLQIWKCPKLKDMPEEGFPASLRCLDIIDCPVLEKELKMKDRKEWLKVARVPNIFIDGKRIQGNESRVYLTERTFGFDTLLKRGREKESNCSGGFSERLAHLLGIQNCPEVESFPEEGLPFNLKIIEITDCKRLIANRREWGLERIPSLETLEIGGGELEDVESFPGGQLLLPTTLTHLRISSFSNLKSMEKEGFQHLISLELLQICKCPKLKDMPEEGFPASLRFLDIKECPVLKKELKRRKGKEWLKVARVPNIFIDDNCIQGNESLLREYLRQRTFGFSKLHKKIVLDLVDLYNYEEVSEIIFSPGGITKVEFNKDGKKLTVTGRLDPVDVVLKIRRKFIRSDIVDIGPPQKY